MLYGIAIYAIAINVIGYVVMGVDKRRAQRNEWRIPEKTLFLIAMMYGSFGVHQGMKRFRHKTKHKSFVIGIPLIEILQVLSIIYVAYRILY